MAFQDITDPGAVQLAIAEFDRVGTHSFLTKYGFKRSRTFFLVVGDREYDSKAIAGAAHGYQFPNLGPLRPSDFSGGEATVARKLRSLGLKTKEARRGALRNALLSLRNKIRQEFPALARAFVDSRKVLAGQLRALAGSEAAARARFHADLLFE